MSGRAQLDQPLQPVVAVDDAAIEIVEIGRGEAAAVQRDERAQLRRDDRNDGHDHPLGLVARDDELLDDLEPLGQLLRLQLGGRLGDLDAQVGGDLLEVEREQHVADGLGADLGGEAVGAVLVLRRRGTALRVSSSCCVNGGQAGIEHDVVLEIEDALDVLEGHVEQQRDAATAATSGTRCGRRARRARYGPCARGARGSA